MPWICAIAKVEKHNSRSCSVDWCMNATLLGKNSPFVTYYDKTE